MQIQCVDLHTCRGMSHANPYEKSVYEVCESSFVSNEQTWRGGRGKSFPTRWQKINNDTDDDNVMIPDERATITDEGNVVIRRVELNSHESILPADQLNRDKNHKPFQLRSVSDDVCRLRRMNRLRAV